MYDGDSSTWSPQGRLHQVEYALEAVKQGSASVGLRSNNYAVLVAIKRSAGELASYQKKLIRVDEHMGIAIAGLTSDARVLSNYMRSEAMKSRLLYNRPLPTSRIVATLGDKAQINTQQYGRRPYGVGLLVIGYDQTGPHLFECTPTGNNFEYYAQGIGSRSQSARTYLERHFEEFSDASLQHLILHGLRALRDTLQQDKKLTKDNLSIAFVGKDEEFTVKDGEDVVEWLTYLEQEGGGGGRPDDAASATGAQATEGGEGEDAMETDE
ncbi:20S proteasome subunit alpha 6 [Piptocephalis cylindrospora]|uniref:Proteasome subunit alpha type n=1 Tax=Piptocephalis cylindrospora TaxID=1907219 RepID=A0A4P9Y5W6_9FUNG|nr:20S proteasome subunit alpha 6 [Piptocephalis cylindrospora]|eukprot:RKP14335.1 20S proteasome subunit alpha 6 [Piptocephalis cylindrospora]